jgi:hypothetical protein
MFEQMFEHLFAAGAKKLLSSSHRVRVHGLRPAAAHAPSSTRMARPRARWTIIPFCITYWCKVYTYRLQ